ncbi:MAG: spore germination protein, partial [Lachnospiraceae bacterium]|nr:spore germination protein [Lachnospiraceae bacterium]
MSTTKTPLSTSLTENIALLKEFLPIGTSFDLVYRNLYLGDTPAYWLGINGFCRTEILQQIFSDLQYPLYTKDSTIDDIVDYVNSKIGYAQVTFSSSWDEILRNVLSGPSVLFIDGFSQAVLIDVRTYPTRSIAEPDTERITKGSRDGFVETLLFNANLIRRRIRSTQLTFATHTVGSESKTDIAIAYLKHSVNQDLLQKVSKALHDLDVTSLTMGAKSLEELLIKKRWWNPLPSIQFTERPDVACSYLLEGHIVIIVDNSPSVLILPGTIFQFTQHPEDYYKSPVTGNYFRLVRFLCIPISLLLMPVFLLLTVYYPAFTQKWHLLSEAQLSAPRLIFYVLAVEFLLDLFKYSASLNSSRFSGSLSIVGGLIIGDIAVSLNWASTEVLFYAAITLLTSLSLSSIEFADALRLYRIFLILTTSFLGIWGFGIGLLLILISIATTPTFGGMSY